VPYQIKTQHAAYGLFVSDLHRFSLVY
jgi:hypothetical protein